jgi:hypothetical protein
VTAGDGTSLADGFTTATSGTGTWGTFEVSAELVSDATGPATITAFQSDMETGGEQDLYEVPVTIG